MRRREILVGLAGGFLSCPLTARSQSAQRLPRVGFLATGFLAQMIDAFKEGLREVGYVEGKTILIEYRQAESQVDRFPALATDLVALKVDVIVATNSLAARAVKQATTTIPVVVPVMGDPVRDGLVVTLAHPGGNVTGLTFLGPELLPKRLALLKEALPTASRVAAIWHPGAYGEPTMTDMMERTGAAARELNLTLEFAPVQVPDDLDPAFTNLTNVGADALLVFPSPMLFTELKRIADLAQTHRLPGIAMGREFAQFGGLMSYGASLADLHRRAALYIDRILKGAKPAELPVEQPISFEFFINLKTAKQLGLAIPPTLLARADEVIE